MSAITSDATVSTPVLVPRAETDAARAPPEPPPAEVATPQTRAADLPTGQLSVVAYPCADVFVDGHQRGTTPLMLRLPVGAYRVMLNGGVPRQEQHVTIRAGHVMAVRAVRE